MTDRIVVETDGERRGYFVAAVPEGNATWLLLTDIENGAFFRADAEHCREVIEETEPLPPHRIFPWPEN